MSEIQANKLSPASGTALTLGDSGDTLTLTAGANLTLGGSSTTITIPSGATITNSGTATGFGGTFGSSYFAANTTSDFTVTDQTFVKAQINNEIVDVGNNYDTSNYRYTVPTTGYYFFYVRGMIDADSDGQLNAVDFFLKKNNSSYVAETNIDFQNNNGRKAGTTLNAILSLSASDYIEWWIYAKDNAGNPILKANTGAGAAGAGNQFGGWRVA